MKILEDNNFLSDWQKEECDKMLGGEFPFYWQDYQVPGDGHPALVHCLLSRTTHGHIIEHDKINSPNFNFCKGILDSFCEKNNIKYKYIYRACINLTLPLPQKHGTLHEDHDFPHKQFILYLNESNGNTLIFNSKRKISKKIKIEKHKGVVFDKCLHAQEYPKKGRRVVLVMTFN
jgi:hypothetical protein